MKISMDKKYQTRDGRPVTLVTTSGPHPWEVVGYVGDLALPDAWSASGKFYESSESIDDLVEVVEPVTQELWVNFYPRHGNLPTCHYAKEYADYHAKPDRIACRLVTIIYTPGEGLT